MKTKKSILISIFALALMVFGVSAVKADDVQPLGVQNYITVCLDGDKDSPINKQNGTSLCYVVAKGWNNNDGTSAGFISQAYSGDGLKIIGTQTYVPDTGSIWVKAGSAAGNNSKVKTDDTKAPAALKTDGKVFCPAAYFASQNKAVKGVESSGCGIFYSQSEVRFHRTNMENKKHDILSETFIKQSATTQYGVIGAYKVQITATTGSGCGQICVQTTEIKTDLDWTCVAAETSETDPKRYDGTDCTDITTSQPGCTEVHYDLTSKAEPEPEDQPNSGAFASYTILAAGALIAISAITIAKKHNRISKI